MVSYPKYSSLLKIIFLSNSKIDVRVVLYQRKVDFMNPQLRQGLSNQASHMPLVVTNGTSLYLSMTKSDIPFGKT